MARRHQSQVSVLSELLHYQLGLRRKRNLEKSHEAHPVLFNDLIANKRETLTAVMKFLDLEFSENLLEDSFRPNKTFKDNAERESHWSEKERLSVKVVDPALRVIPSPVLEGLYRLFKAVKPSAHTVYDSETFVHGSFRKRLRELEWDE